jgi:hypothetical protein
MTNYGDTVDASYAIIAGSRRFNASVEAGRETVPCNVIEADDLEAAVKSLKENQEREDLTQTEMATSIRMQYEMLNPAEEVQDGESIECKHCGYKSESIAGLGAHFNASDCDGCTSRCTRRDIQIRPQAIDWLANVHYPDLEKSARKDKIRRLLASSELPAEFKILLKSTDDRTDSEEATLERVGIDSDREMSVHNTRTDSGFKAALDLYEDLKSLDGVNEDSKLLDAVGELDRKQNDSKLSERLNNVREELNKQVADAETDEEEREAFSDALSVERNKVTRRQEADVNDLAGVNFSLDEPKFNRYHARAKEMHKEETDIEMVKTGYEKYLDDLSDEHGW